MILFTKYSFILNQIQIGQLHYVSRIHAPFDDVLQLAILLFDGEFTNRVDVLHIDEYFIINDLYDQPFVNVQKLRVNTTIYHLEDWKAIDTSKCQYDLNINITNQDRGNWVRDY